MVVRLVGLVVVAVLASVLLVVGAAARRGEVEAPAAPCAACARPAPMPARAVQLVEGIRT
jgi:hypothetical protein